MVLSGGNWWKIFVDAATTPPVSLDRLFSLLYRFRVKRRYNWKPDLPDFRDLLFTVTAPQKNPPHIDLREHCSPIVNQGKIGSCTGNALAAACEFLELKELKSKSGGDY